MLDTRQYITVNPEKGEKINGATQTKSGRLTVLMRQCSKFTQAKGA